MATQKCQFPLWNDGETQHHICGEEPAYPWGYDGRGSMTYCTKHINELVEHRKVQLLRDYQQGLADLMERHQNALAALQVDLETAVKSGGD